MLRPGGISRRGPVARGLAGAVVCLGSLLITLAGGQRLVTILFVLVWGAGFGAVPVAAQTWSGRAAAVDRLETVAGEARRR
jgi:hypothetical protein